MSDSDADAREPDELERRADKGLAKAVAERRAFRRLLDDAIDHAARISSPDALAGARPWVPLGPRNIGGRIRALEQHPTDARTVYAGSALGGLWRTTDAGESWVPLDDFRPPNPPNNVPQALPIGAIAIAPGSPDVLYVGTGEPVMGRTFKASEPTGFSDYHYPGAGLYRSTDGGATFEQIDHPQTGTIRAHRFERILVDPRQHERCWIACDRGLWRREPGAVASVAQDVIDATDVPAIQNASDIAIDFVDRSQFARPFHLMVYVALRGGGIYRARFDTLANDYVVTDGRRWKKLSGPFPGDFHRVKLALCRSRPSTLYAVFGLPNRRCSRVFRSENGGDHWERTGPGPDAADQNQSEYDLLVEAHPEHPNIVFFGAVDLYRSMNGGEAWEKVQDGARFYENRGEHADQHALLFDIANPRMVWVGNDGGISISQNLGGKWRKRSHGILAAQFYDVTSHPTFPFIVGGGLQDNQTWVGYGGGTWHILFSGDGGQMAFQPRDAQDFLITSQNRVGRATISSTTSTAGTYLSPLPDVTGPPPAALVYMRSSVTTLSSGIDREHKPTFVGLVVHHPTTRDHFLIGRERAGYLTTDGATFTRLGTGDFTPAAAEVSALAYAPSSPATHWWLGTSHGQVFRTTNANTAGAWGAVTPPDLGQRWIGGIAVHPTNRNVVAVAVAGEEPGRVFLTGDGGTSWEEISGRSSPAPPPGSPAGPSAAGAGDRLNPSPITSVAFDPQSPAAVDDPQSLYVGTLAGVYVIRNASPPHPARPAAAMRAPVWRTFNNGLPLVLVYDIEAVVSRERDAVGVGITRTLLRCATFGRGIYECDLAGTAPLRLLIRSNIIDDGRTYDPAAPAIALANDPRRTPATLVAFDRSIDLRIDAPPYSFFDEALDGVEFDEAMRIDQPKAGERNLVYVQVHNGGHRAVDVGVHLYAAPAAGAPAAAPDLQADFWDHFTADPIPGAPWQRVDAMQIARRVGPAQPRVVRFAWELPSAAIGDMALLAVATHADDPIADPAAAPPLVPTLQVDATTHGAASLVRSNRRAALRIASIAPFTPDVFVRDGVDDTGASGDVAWGARSPDIVVVPAAVPDPDAAFADGGDRRLGDRVTGGTDNQIYVRVHNRTTSPLDAELDVFQIPFATFADHSSWVSLGTAQALAVPPQGWRFAGPIVLPSPADPDPSPTHAYKVVLLAALIGRVGDDRPDPSAVTDLESFWRFFLADPSANNACLRGLRFVPPAP